MLPSFADITSRIAEAPSWYDAHGTPRYGEFSPDDLGVYDESALLVEIGCQACDRRFLVADGYCSFDRIDSALRAAHLADERKDPEVLEREAYLRRAAAGFHFGDPPRHECSGDTMNCINYRVVEAWIQDQEWPNGESDERWIRLPELEGDLELPEWAR